MNIESILSDNGFTVSFDVSSRHSISDLLGKKSRCGIYVLSFLDETYYVGQAIDVCRRFLQHKKNRNDIVKIYFKSEHKSNLNSYEIYTIRLLEKHTILRNINYASMPELSCSELDQLIKDDEQKIWLSSSDSRIMHYKRVEDLRLRSRTEKRAEKMIYDQIFSKLVLPVMKKYTEKCIIEPYLTELTYWGCTCINTISNNFRLYSRINLRFQEVFTTGYDHARNTPTFSWHLAKSPFEGDFGKDSRIEFIDHYYQSGGQNQFQIYTEDFDSAMWLLNNEIFVHAAKSFNLGCMRKGAQPYAKTHCPTLADYLLPEFG